MFTRSQLIDLLRPLKAELAERYRVEELALFGSLTRQEQGPKSDQMWTFWWISPKARHKGVDRFGARWRNGYPGILNELDLLTPYAVEFRYDLLPWRAEIPLDGQKAWKMVRGLRATDFNPRPRRSPADIYLRFLRRGLLSARFLAIWLPRPAPEPDSRTSGVFQRPYENFGRVPCERCL